MQGASPHGVADVNRRIARHLEVRSGRHHDVARDADVSCHLVGHVQGLDREVVGHPAAIDGHIRGRGVAREGGGAVGDAEHRGRQHHGGAGIALERVSREGGNLRDSPGRVVTWMPAAAPSAKVALAMRRRPLKLKRTLAGSSKPTPMEPPPASATVTRFSSFALDADPKASPFQNPALCVLPRKTMGASALPIAASDPSPVALPMMRRPSRWNSITTPGSTTRLALTVRQPETW